jgi:hypothetical protein
VGCCFVSQRRRLMFYSQLMPLECATILCSMLAHLPFRTSRCLRRRPCSACACACRCVCVDVRALRIYLTFWIKKRNKDKTGSVEVTRLSIYGIKIISLFLIENNSKIDNYKVKTEICCCYINIVANSSSVLKEVKYFNFERRLHYWYMF